MYQLGTRMMTSFIPFKISFLSNVSYFVVNPQTVAYWQYR
jgi:hypothetical protein